MSDKKEDEDQAPAAETEEVLVTNVHNTICTVIISTGRLLRCKPGRVMPPDHPLLVVVVVLQMWAQR